MIHIIYGIRVHGASEARYVGQTRIGPEARLNRLLTEAKWVWRAKSPFDAWLIENEADLEVFEIARADCRADALRRERETVEVCLSLGHRLFNSHLVPTNLRIVRRPAQDRAA